ncbi:MAG: hypothetical protein ABR614_14110 [Mycobacteriales bacterium]
MTAPLLDVRRSYAVLAAASSPRGKDLFAERTPWLRVRYAF